MESIWRIFSNRRMPAMLALGFASGLPYLLVTDNLQLWLKHAGATKSDIGLFSLVWIPFAFKFVWAPLIDRYVPPFLGRRRGWLLITQFLLILTIAMMSLLNPAASLLNLAALAMLVTFFSASQDIAADAYRVDLLSPAERGIGTALWVGGYRVAMIAIGAGAMIIVGQYSVSWNTIYLLSAAAMSVGLIATLLAPEPFRPGKPPTSLADAIILPLKDLLLRPGGLLILLFILLFRLPDVMVRTMTLPFMQEIGIKLQAIGAIKQGLGLGMTILGALVGGAIIARYSLYRSLWIFGSLQALSCSGFWLLAKTGPVYSVMVAAIVAENFCAGLVMAGFTSFLMSQCQIRFSAFQFALLSSIMRLTDILGGAPTGFLASHLGWQPYFILSILAGLPWMFLLPFLKFTPAQPDPEESPAPSLATTEY